MSELQLKKNISVLYAFSFFWLALVIIPVIVPFFATKGLSLADVFVLQSVFALSVVVFEVPSGYLADMIGRRRALILGSVFHGVGFTLLCFAESFAGLALFEITVGLGMSLLSGSDLSLLYDSQLALNMSPQEKTRGIARFRFIKATAEGIAALLGGVLVLWSFDVVVYVNAIIAWVPLFLSFRLVEAPYQRMQAESPLSNFRRILMHLFYRDSLLRLTTLALTFYGLSTFYVVWLIQPYWESYGIPLAAFGALWAAKNFTVGVAARFCAPLEEKYGPVPVLVVMALLPVAGYLGMAAGGGLAGILLSFTFYISRGFHQVILTDAFNSRVPSAFRATANSMTGFLFRLTFIVTGPLVGFLYEWQGMAVTLTALGVASLLLFLVLMVPLLRQVAGIVEAVPDATA
ncbi:MAG: MFS transporter [Gammaproteobacteria bacterium]|jgi:MFS family permease|nr:MFS transporter [Gammaproteobacteria bacterium]MBT4493012.1 MFS transporter [Gammaproteobacteria bacterium]MBT7371507.1 MFS transporter [Gammaproteobacteria bacterium]